MIQPIKSALTICHSIRVSDKHGLLLIIVLLTLLIPAITGYARTRIIESPHCMQSPAETRRGVATEVADVPSLTQGKPIERELTGGEAHSYRLMLVADQFCHIVVDQRGIDVAVALHGPSGERIVEIDGTSGRSGPEPISLVAEASGSYRLEVRSLVKTAPGGRYVVKIEELRAATPRDKIRVDAQKAFMEAKSLQNQGTAESLRRA